MHKKLVLLILMLPLLSSCTFPAGLTARLPFLNRLQSVDCNLIRAGILIGGESDEIAQEQRDGYELALQEINGNVGVAGCDLQVFYQIEDETDTSNTNPRQTYQSVRTLVEDNDVLAVMGGTSSSASMVAASLANYFNVPMLIPSAGGSHILPAENRWGFRLHALETSYSGLVFELIKQELGPGLQTVIVFEDSTFGHDAAIAAVNAAQANEQDVVGYFFYDPSQTGADILAKQVLELQPQLVYLAFSETQQSENILAALDKEKGALGIIRVARAGGFATHEFLIDSEEETLASAENLLLVARWSGDIESSLTNTSGDRFAASFAEYSKAKYGEAQQPTLYNAEAYKSLMILAHTLERTLANKVESAIEVQKIRENLRQALFNYKEVSPVWGTIDFSNGGQNQGAIALLQMIDGRWQVVYPVDKAETDLFLDYQPR